MATMVRPFAIAALLVALPWAGCRDNGGSATRAQSAAARAQCEREAQTSDPPGRGALVGAFDTTVKAVQTEYRRLYHKDLLGGGLADRKGKERLALCYYDVPAEETAVSPPGRLGPIERISIAVDAQLNSFGINGGPKSAIPVKGIG
jgi:hypothetical protein